ncbi:MAG: T9SS type A sorting domain-containing protein [Bacteroidales bacterium]
MRCRFCFLGCFLLFSVVVFSQKPLGKFAKLMSPPSVFSKIVVAPPSQDSISEFSAQSRAYTFAYPISAHISFVKEARRIVYDDSTLFYNLQISAKDARSLNLIFTDFFLPKGSSLQVYSRDSTFFYGPYTSEHNNDAQVFATPVVRDSVICISVSVPRELSDSLSLTIQQISYGFRDFENSLKSLKSNNDLSGDCQVNVNCSQGVDWQKEKRAVSRLIIDGTTVCTGSLVNNTAQDGRPFVLTANHCVSTDFYASTVVFYFGYEYLYCSNSTYLTDEYIQSGSYLRATDIQDKIDFSLLEMYKPPSEVAQPYYLGWDVTDDVDQPGSVTLHHPRGDPMKISIDTDFPTSSSFFTYKENTHWQISDWEFGATEGGSSGAPLLNTQHKLFGTLSGGEASCSNPVNDYFSKLSAAFYNVGDSTQNLHYWLDPLHFSAEQWPGYNPYDTKPSFLSNILNADSIYNWHFDEYAPGTMGGGNNWGWNAVAEEFLYNTEKYIVSASYMVDVEPCQQLQNIELCVWTGGITPDSLVYTQAVEPEDIIDSSYIIISPDEPIETTGNFWVGYRFLESDTCVSFLFSDNEQSRSRSLKLLYDTTWIYASQIDARMALAVEVSVTSMPDTVNYMQENWYEKPDFATRISENEKEFYSHPLFAFDSIEAIYDTTILQQVSTHENIADWGKPDFFDANCVANKYTINESKYVRGLKLGVNNRGNADSYINYCVWNSDYEIVAQDSVLQHKLRNLYYNQVHFSSPVFVQDDFYAGVCYHDNEQDIMSLYQYFDYDFFVDAYYSLDSLWFPYGDFDISYNFAIQPITCFSEYHYNQNADSILQYPIRNTAKSSFSIEHDAVVYPLYCKDFCFVKWHRVFYDSFEVAIMDNNGVLKKKQTVFFANGTYSIDVRNIPAGMYTIVITTKDFEFSKKIIVRR